MVDPAKTKDVLNLRAPKTATEVRGFIGAMNFYRRFIPDYAQLAEPIQRLLKGKTKRMSVEKEWVADPLCELCFRALKTSLASSPVLIFPDFKKPFIVSTDVSKRQIGASLMQLDDDAVERPVAFGSRQLTKCEQNYTISERECLAVVFATRKFRKYLHSAPDMPVTVLTDHSALTSLNKFQDPHNRLVRFAIELSEYPLLVVHRPGADHHLPDLLSRCGLEEGQAAATVEQFDQLLKGRLEVMLESVYGASVPGEVLEKLYSDENVAERRRLLEEKGPLSDDQMSHIFSESNLQLRLQMLVRGASASDDYDVTVREIARAFEDQRASEIQHLKQDTGEWCPQSEAMDMVSAVDSDYEESESEEKVTSGTASMEGVVQEALWNWEQGPLGEVAAESEGEQLLQLVAAVTRQLRRVNASRGARRGREGGPNEPRTRATEAAGGGASQTSPLPVQAEEVITEPTQLSPPDPEEVMEPTQLSPPDPEEVEEEEEPAHTPSVPPGVQSEARRLRAVADFEKDPTAALKREQNEDVFASSMRRYLMTKQLPRGDQYLRRRVLEKEDQFVVSEGVGLLQRRWFRDPRRRATLEPVLQTYVPETLRGEVMARYHGGDRTGHLSPMKTWQRLMERYWWPGMSADVFSAVRSCGVCQTRGRRPPKQKIQGHVRSDVPGEIWMLDVLYLPVSKQGRQHVLTMIDVATRWAYFVPLDKVDSISVVRAVEHHLIGEGVNPKMFITDNGSEFKKDFSEFCSLYNLKVRRSVPHHAEGHGIVEAANRTISDIIGHMVEEDGDDWEENLPWARRAYLSSVHTALSKGVAGLTPAEAFRGWAVQLPLDVALKEVGEDAAVSSARVRGKVRRAMAWMEESRKDYEHAMESTKRNVHRRERAFKVGDKVRLFKPPLHKTDRKVGRVYQGPYIVIDCLRHGEGKPSEYVVRREGGGDRTLSKVRATAERLRLYVDSQPESTALSPEEVQSFVDAAPAQQWEVKRITMERGSTSTGTKQYRVEWVGDWESTWEPEQLVNAPEAVQEYHVRKHRQRRPEVAAVLEEGGPEVGLEVVTREGSWVLPHAALRAITLRGDLGVRSVSTIWEAIRKKAGFEWEDVLLVWASPPCQTFSPADYSNISRNNNFRRHDDPERPPTVTNPDKARVARSHDVLVQQLLEMFQHARLQVPGVACAMENPRGSLACRPYMQPEVLPCGLKYEVLDQCAFDRDYRKTTHLIHNMEGLQLKGNTGDGRCHERCGKGEFVCGRYRHFKALAMEPIRGPRGQGHTKEKNELPAMLLREVMAQALKEAPSGRRKVVVDLCSGFQSWRPVAAEFGCRYVAIDISGDRNVRGGGVAPEVLNLL